MGLLYFFLPYGGYADIFRTRVSVIPNCTLFIHSDIKARCATLTSVTSNTRNRAFFVQCVRKSLCIYNRCWKFGGDRGGTVVKVLCYKSEGRWFDPRLSLEFFIDIILPIALWPWGDSASNRNEYQEDFLGVKTADA